jgi:superfamily I DNA/RNA helicase
VSTKPKSHAYSLNEDQKRAVHANAKGIQIVAPAGSGKTETLVHRSIELIRTKGVLPRQVLILSFDNSAKQSFERKYRRYAQGLPLPVVKTINKFGVDLLKQYFPREIGSLKQDAELRRSYDQRFGSLDVLHWDGRHRTVTGAFDALKYQGFAVPDLRQHVAREWLRRHFLNLPEEHESVSATDLWDLDPSPSAADQFNTDIDKILEGYRAFEEEMQHHGWMDFADQKLRPLLALRRDVSARAEVQGQYSEIVVDECQDISRLDALLIRFVLGPDTTLVVAGDDDQSLYEFREANSLYLRDPSRYFERDFEACHLNINYRTPQELLEPALKLIDHNGERIPKSPHSGLVRSGTLEILRASTDRDLASKVVERLVELTKRTGTYQVSPDEIGVLCATTTSVSRYRRSLTGAGIPWIAVTGAENGARSIDGVTVDTMRKAKGQQWRVVILPDTDDASVPGPQSMRFGDTESQRRMFYVAMTRPSEQLIIGYASKESIDVAYRTSEDEIVGTNGASRFLFEAGLVSEPVVSHSQVEAKNPQLDRPAAIVATGIASVSLSSPPAHLVPESTIEPPPPDIVDSSRSRQLLIEAKNQDHLKSYPGRQDPVLTQAARFTDKGRLRPWHMRESERKALEKAQMRVLGNDHEYAAVDAFDKAIVPFLKRVLRAFDSSRERTLDSVLLINLIAQRNAMDIDWQKTLHAWRMARNRCVHDLGAPNAEVIRCVNDMVERAPSLFAHIRTCLGESPESTVNSMRTAVNSGEPRADTLPHAPFIDAERLRRISLLADIIQTQQPHPNTGKRVKSLRFDPDTFREEMLVLQLHFLLRDVRFHISETYRWSQSSIFAQLSLRELQYCHASIRGTGRHGLQPLSVARADDLVDILSGILDERLGEAKVDSFRATLNDAVGTQNGNYPAGFKIRAYRIPKTT